MAVLGRGFNKWAPICLSPCSLSKTCTCILHRSVISQFRHSCLAVASSPPDAELITAHTEAGSSLNVCRWSPHHKRTIFLATTSSPSHPYVGSSIGEVAGEDMDRDWRPSGRTVKSASVEEGIAIAATSTPEGERPPQIKGDRTHYCQTGVPLLHLTLLL